MSDNIFFTVIIPAYNRLGLIKDSIESVLNQSYEDFEIIVVDDCSIDGSYEYLCSLYKKNEKVRIFKNEKNQGRCYSRNLGIKKSRGKWICYLDSDDTYLENHLETFYSLISKFPNIKAFASNQSINNVPKKYNDRKLNNSLSELTLDDFIVSNPLTPNQICYNRELNLLWSEERIPISEDLLFMRILTLKTEILKTNVVTNNISDHSERSIYTTEVDEFVKWNIFASDKFIRENNIPKKIRNKITSHTLLLCANILLNNGNKKDGINLLCKSIKHKNVFTFSLFYKAIVKTFK